MAKRSRSILLIGFLLAAHCAGQPTYAQAPYHNVIFLHHSVGADLIQRGHVREGLTALGYQFYDHGYNEDGLTLPNGEPAGYSYDIPDDNTNPDGFAAIFAQPLRTPPDNAFSRLMQHQVLAFKSCFPVSDIQSDEQLNDYKSYYLSVRSVVDQHRGHVFVVVTPPPLSRNATNPADAARARAFANWLRSPTYLNGHPNLFTFDFFDVMAESNPSSPYFNCLRQAYQPDESDSHPNEQADRVCGPLFVAFIDNAVRSYTQAATPTATVRAATPTSTSFPATPTRTRTQGPSRTPGRFAAYLPIILKSVWRQTMSPTATHTPEPSETSAGTPAACPGTTMVISRGIRGTVADAYIWQSEPDYTGNWETLYTGCVGAGRKQTLLRFDLAALGSGATVRHATLRIHQKWEGKARTVNVHRIMADWQEDSVTWRSFAGGYDRIVIGTFGSAAAGWKEVDVTSLVRGWLNGTVRNCGLLLDDPGAGADQNEEYDSSECGDVGLRPRLEVCLPGQ